MAALPIRWWTTNTTTIRWLRITSFPQLSFSTPFQGTNGNNTHSNSPLAHSYTEHGSRNLKLNCYNNWDQRTTRIPRTESCRGFSTSTQHVSATSIEDSNNNNNNNNDDNNDDDGPWGDLLNAPIGPDLVGKAASYKRTFGPRSNAQGFLLCGGEALAKHASFDPDYGRAQDWIRRHAVGPAKLSPVLISGLVGTLVEAALPQAIFVRASMKQVLPLIVGIEVCARIEVVASLADGRKGNDHSSSSKVLDQSGEDQQYDRQNGYEVQMKTLVSRVRDNAIIAEGLHVVWIPDYLHM